MGIDKKELDVILKWFEHSTLTSATIEHTLKGDYKISLTRAPSALDLEHYKVQQQFYTAASSGHTPMVAQAGVSPTQETGPPKHAQENKEAEPSNIKKITAPIVGTLYRSPGPDSPPFIQVGDTVNKGSTLCIIEAMKVMNELEAEYDMEIISIHVDNSELVEFGQVLFEVKVL